MSGKGSKPRPYSVSHETFGERWEAAFGKKKNPRQVADAGIEAAYMELLAKEMGPAAVDFSSIVKVYPAKKVKTPRKRQ